MGFKTKFSDDKGVEITQISGSSKITINNKDFPTKELTNFFNQETKNKNVINIYVSVSGSDSNTGLSDLSPVQTLSKAFTLIPNVLHNSVFIHLMPGVHVWDKELRMPNVETKSPSGSIVFWGSGDDSSDGFDIITTGSISTGSTSTEWITTNNSMTVDEYIGCSIRWTSGNNIGQIRNVLKNTSGSLSPNLELLNIPQNGDTFEITKPNAIINFENTLTDEYGTNNKINGEGLNGNVYVGGRNSLGFVNLQLGQDTGVNRAVVFEDVSLLFFGVVAGPRAFMSFVNCNIFSGLTVPYILSEASTGGVATTDYSKPKQYEKNWKWFTDVVKNKIPNFNILDWSGFGFSSHAFTSAGTSLSAIDTKYFGFYNGCSSFTSFNSDLKLTNFSLVPRQGLTAAPMYTYGSNILISPTLLVTSGSSVTSSKVRSYYYINTATGGAFLNALGGEGYQTSKRLVIYQADIIGGPDNAGNLHGLLQIDNQKAYLENVVIDGGKGAALVLNAGATVSYLNLTLRTSSVTNGAPYGPSWGRETDPALVVRDGGKLYAAGNNGIIRLTVTGAVEIVDGGEVTAQKLTILTKEGVKEPSLAIRNGAKLISIAPRGDAQDFPVIEILGVDTQPVTVLVNNGSSFHMKGGGGSSTKIFGGQTAIRITDGSEFYTAGGITNISGSVDGRGVVIIERGSKMASLSNSSLGVSSSHLYFYGTWDIRNNHPSGSECNVLQVKGNSIVTLPSGTYTRFIVAGASATGYGIDARGGGRVFFDGPPTEVVGKPSTNDLIVDNISAGQPDTVLSASDTSIVSVDNLSCIVRI